MKITIAIAALALGIIPAFAKDFTVRDFLGGTEDRVQMVALVAGITVGVIEGERAAVRAGRKRLICPKNTEDFSIEGLRKTLTFVALQRPKVLDTDLAETIVSIMHTQGRCS